MKKLFAVAAILSAALVSFKFSGTRDDNRGLSDKQTQGRALFEARRQDGSFDISKIYASSRLPDELKEEFKNADKNKDGRVSLNELKAANIKLGIVEEDEVVAEQGTDERENARRVAQASWNDTTERPGMIPEGMRERRQSATPQRRNQKAIPDFDAPWNAGSQLLTRRDARPDFHAPKRENENGAIDVHKLDALMRLLDKNNDGVVDGDERQMYADAVRAAYPDAPFAVEQLFGAKRERRAPNPNPYARDASFNGTPEFEGTKIDSFPETQNNAETRADDARSGD